MVTPLYISRRGGPGRGALLALRLGVMAAAVAAPAGCSRNAPEKPNVLVVVISGLRADHVSAYGYRRPTTPAIDALASSGTLFENAIAAAPWPLTSQASLATGLYPSEHMAAFEHPVLEGSLETLAEKLKASGYATFAVSTDSDIGQGNGFGQGFDAYVEMRPEAAGSPDDGAAAAESELLGWIAAQAGAGGETPFFAQATLTNPRLPFNPPGEYQQKFLEKPIPLPRLERITQLWIPFARQFTLGVASLPPDEMQALVSLYDGEVAYADYRVGRVAAALRDERILDHTLVVITSDVGEDLGDHGLLADASNVYDTMVKVPLVMRLPGPVPAGARVADQVQSLDIMKTVLALVSAPDGRAPPRVMEPRQAAVTEARFEPAAVRYYQSISPGADLSIFERNLVAVRTPQFKYIVNSRGSHALFDLASDPGERNPVTQERAEEVSEMQARLGRWAAALRPPARPPGAPAASAPAGPSAPQGGAPR